jgi:hypothetical protein
LINQYAVNDVGYLFASATYAQVFELYGVSDSGSHVDTSAGTFQDQSFTVEVHPYGYTYDWTFVYSYGTYTTLSDFTTTPFQLQLAWSDYGDNGAFQIRGFYVLINDGTSYYWKDVGNVTSLQVSDFTGWEQGTPYSSFNNPYYVPAGSLYSQNYWSVYAKNASGLKTVYSSNYSSAYDYGDYYGWSMALSWDAVEGATSYIVYNTTAGCWIETTDTSIIDNGDNSYWNYGAPDVSPSSPVIENKDFLGGHNTDVSVKLNGYGQFETTAGTGISPLKVNSPTLNENLNADLLDGQHAYEFQPAGSYQPAGVYVTNIIASGGLSVSSSGASVTIANAKTPVIDTGTNVLEFSYTSSGASIRSKYKTAWTNGGSIFAEMVSRSNITVKTVYNDGIYYSTNRGVSWNRSNLTNLDYRCLKVTNGVWHVALQSSPYTLKYSLTGTNWLDTNITCQYGNYPTYNAMPNYLKDKWIAGYPQLYYSTDGTNFTQCTQPYGSSMPYSLTYENGYFFAPSIANSDNRQGVMRSTDGITWVASGVSWGFGGGFVLYRGGKWLYFPGSAYWFDVPILIQVSSDAHNWSVLPNSPWTSSNQWTERNNILLLSGSFGNPTYYSDDSGVTWKTPVNNYASSGGNFGYIQEYPDFFVNMNYSGTLSHSKYSRDLITWYNEPSLNVADGQKNGGVAPNGQYFYTIANGAGVRWATEAVDLTPVVFDNVTGRTLLGTSTNNTQFSSAGFQSMAGGARPWRDETMDVLSLQVTGTRVTNNMIEGVADFASNAVYHATFASADALYCNVQFNHDRDLTNNVYPHVHWWQVKSNAPNFLIEHRWQKTGGTKTTAWTKLACTNQLFTYGAGTVTNQVAYAPAGITPPTGSAVSDILQLRLYRDTANASAVFAGADPYNSGTATNVNVLSFDVHIRINSLGSSSEYSK